MKRRDALKGLITIPVVGAVFYGAYRKKHYEKKLKEAIHGGVDLELPVHPPVEVKDGKKIHLGFIGVGSRGSHLMRAAGFATPEYIDHLKEEASRNSNDTRLEDFLSQPDLNVEVTAICDVFDVHAEEALRASANIYREGTGGKFGKPAVRYKTYKELIASPDVDAVVIATPDHWHAPMAIEAALHGKHVYVEKPMTKTIDEVYQVREAVKKSGIVFQLGHQNRQTDSYNIARLAVEKGLLGKITLTEVTTNRNNPVGAWVYEIHPEASPKNIDWEQFIGNAPWHEFSLERFFRWRCWWDYSTGLNGDLLTHEYDAVNQILNVGVPSSAVCSGGIYFFKDGRTVPDVNHAVFEYHEKEMTVLYSATLANGRNRGKVFMGHDASMEVSEKLTIYAEYDSPKYKERIEKGIIDPSVPIYSYAPGKDRVDAVTSPTEKYFASRGLLYTYRGGKRFDTTFLHLSEWLQAIRGQGQVSCNVDRGFECTMAAHMATLSYHTGRRIYWDRDKEQVVVGEKVS